MSEVNANIVVEPIDLTIQQNNPGITITPNAIALTVYTGGYGSAGGSQGQLQYNNQSISAGVPNTFFGSGNLSLGSVANIKIAGGANALFLQTDGTGNLVWAAGISNISGNGVPAGANQQMQFNGGAGNFDSQPGFFFDKATNVFAAPGQGFFDSNINTNAFFVGNGANITGNVSANYYFGDAGLLSNLPGGAFLSNGTSNVSIPVANSNIFVGVNGTANVASFTPTGIDTISVAAGNIKTDNLLYANGAPWDIEQPAGNTGDIQYNANGNFGANPNLSWNNSTQTLSSYIVNANSVTAGNVKTDNLLYANGNPWDFELPAGNTGEVQFNNAGSFGASANLIWDNTFGELTTRFLKIGSSNICLGAGTPSGTQGADAIAIGFGAGSGNLAQRQRAIAIGLNAGVGNGQGNGAIAIGESAGRGNLIRAQGNNAIAIGVSSGLLQGNSAIAIGDSAAPNNQGSNSIAIGTGAGGNFLGQHSIAIGSFAGQTSSSYSSTIILNSTGAALNPTRPNSTYIKPVQNTTTGNLFYYDPTTGEVTYGSGLLANSTSNITVNTSNILMVIGGVVKANLTTSSLNLSVTLNTATANITTAFIGTGNFATAVETPLIRNGNSNIAITNNGNITITSNSSSQVVITSTGVNVAGTANIVGNLNANLINGTLATASQPNITSLGTLTALNVSGNIISGNANLGNAATANFFVGDGTYLTNISVTGGTSIVNGNSNVFVYANGNVAVSVAGVSNTVVFSSTQANLGNLAVANNITINNVANITGNLNAANANITTLVGSSANFTGNLSAGNANLGQLATANFFTGILTTNAQPNITSVGNLTALVVSGNTTSNNISITNNAQIKLLKQNISNYTGNTGNTTTVAAGLEQYTIFNVYSNTGTNWTLDLNNLRENGVGKTYLMLVRNNSLIANITVNPSAGAGNSIMQGQTILTNRYALLEVNMFDNIATGTWRWANLS